jgi:uncharacterized membrane protein (UPF0127 family)
MGFSARACPWGLGGSWLLILCLAVILGGPARAQSALQVFERDSLVVATASGEEHRFEVELATTWQQQAQGLMLDMLFIDRDGRIVSLSERTVPLSLKRISSGLPALAVLELNAGTVARLGLKPGDRIIHRAFGT